MQHRCVTHLYRKPLNNIHCGVVQVTILRREGNQSNHTKNSEVNSKINFQP